MISKLTYFLYKLINVVIAHRAVAKHYSMYANKIPPLTAPESASPPTLVASLVRDTIMLHSTVCTLGSNNTSNNCPIKQMHLTCEFIFKT